MTERDIIRRLQESPVPPPPEDLAARIINDIPDEIEVHPDLERAEPGRRFIHRRPVWLAAAAAAAVALTAAVTWELRHESPTPEMLSQYRAEEVIDHEPGLESPSADEDRVDAATDTGDAVESKKIDNIWSRLGVEGDTVAETDAREKNAERSSRVGKDVDSLRQTPGRDAPEEESVLTAVTTTEAKAREPGRRGGARRTRPGSQPTLRVPIPDPTPDEPAPVEAAIAGKLEQPAEKRASPKQGPERADPNRRLHDGTRSQRELAGGPVPEAAGPMLRPLLLPVNDGRIRSSQASGPLESDRLATKAKSWTRAGRRRLKRLPTR